LPDLDLEHLYSQVEVIIEESKPKPTMDPKKKMEGSRKKTKIVSELGPEPPKGLYTDSLSNYIVQAYQKCKEKERDEAVMTELLKEEISNAQRTGQLNRDWSKHALPILPAERPKASTITFDKVQPTLNYRGFQAQLNSLQKPSIIFQILQMVNH
jgi:hypothetical protein